MSVGVAPYTEADFKKTKGGLIRTMSDERLAQYIFHLGNGCEYCYGHCIHQDDEEACAKAQDTPDGCIAGVLAWLKSPVEKDPWWR